MKKYKKRKILIIIVALLIVFRIFLPTIVKSYLNKVLADIPGYTGYVEDVDIALYRGAYVIKGMHLSVLEADTEIPFINLPVTDISVEWKSIFKGSIVSEIFLTDPEITYVLEDQEGSEGAEAEDWTKALTDIVPLDINHFEVNNGKIGLVMTTAEPNIDLSMDNLDLIANNLKNVISAPRTLPSPIEISASTFGDGNLTMEGKMNLLKEIPDMDISFKLEGSDVKALNDFTNYYGKLDFESGIFSVFGEVAIADSFLKGYVKPLIKDAKFISKEESILEKIWEGFVGVFKFILKNQRTDTIALRVPFEGDLANVETPIWPTIKSIFKNAWIKALDGDVDDTIEYKDAFQDGHEMTKKEKKEAKKEAKKEEKEKDEKN